MADKLSTFAERLQTGLHERDLKPAELARMTGIDKSSISRYLKGAYKGNQDAVYKIAQALNVSEAWLMGYDVPMERADNSDSAGASPPDEIGYNDFTYALFQESKELTPENQEKLLEMARFFKQQQEQGK